MNSISISYLSARSKLALMAGLAVLAAAPLTFAGEVTLDSLLREMVDYSAIAKWPAEEFTCRQASSYDRAEVAPDQPGWFANNDFSQYIRTENINGRQEHVMMDADGPGCIVRFWLTTVKNKKGTLRVYLDGDDRPAISFPAYDLLAGDLNLGAPLDQPHPGYSPTDNGGNTLRLPIPYAKHCKVTWQEAGDGPRYYQIDYRTYAAGTRVETFTRERLAAAQLLIDRASKELMAPPEPASGKTTVLIRNILARQKATVDLPKGPAAIREMQLRLDVPNTTNLERALRSVVLRMNFDGEETVWCPATDFFGSGVGINPLQSWYRTVNADGTMTCRWVMPYAKSAHLTLVNLGENPVSASLRARTEAWSWDDLSLHFHANWHYEASLHTPPARDWNMIHIAGRGVYAGDTLSLFNSVPTWYGEGDEKIRVDGEALPSFLGTGMEDYYDFSFAPRGLMQTPFANQVRVDQPMTQGHNVLSRTRNLDGIPFTKSLDFNFELISWKPTTLTYAATTYWYAFPGATANVPPQPAAAAAPVPTLAEAIAANAPRHFPGAIECEKLTVLAKSGEFSVHAQDMEPFDASRWSGGAQLLAEPTSPGDYLELEVPATDDAPKRLVLHATQARDYAQLRFTVNGEKVAATYDGYAPEVQPAAALDLGVFRPSGANCLLRVEVTGANPAAVPHRYLIGLDYLELISL